MVAARISEPTSGAIPRRAVILIVAITVFWGLNWPAMRVAVLDLSPWLFRAISVPMAAAALLATAFLAGERVVLPRAEILPLFGVAVFSVTGWNMFSALGLAHMGGGRAVIIAYTMPVFASLLAARMLAEPLDFRRVAALVVGMAGVVVLVRPDLPAIAREPAGLVFMLAAAASWGTGIVRLKAHRTELGAVALTGWQLVLGGAPIVLVASILAPPLEAAPSTAGILCTVYAGLIGLAFCFTAHNRVIGLVPAGVAAISTLATPAVGLFASAWLLGERVGAAELGALASVTLAVGLVLVPGRRRA